MKIIIDRAKIQRRARLAHIASVGGMLILLGSVAISLWQPGWTILAGTMLFFGGVAAMVGIYYANRWVKRPRPEDVLNEALKGLDDRHRLYHYCLPCDHLLLTPGSILVIETVNLEGRFDYRRGKWQQKITAGRAMRFFVEEKLGDPIKRAQDFARQIRALLIAATPEANALEAHAMVVFTNPFVELNVDNPPIPVCGPKKLRSRLPKTNARLSPEVLSQVQKTLDQMAGLLTSI